MLRRSGSGGGKQFHNGTSPQIPLFAVHPVRRKRAFVASEMIARELPNRYPLILTSRRSCGNPDRLSFADVLEIQLCRAVVADYLSIL